MFESLWGETFDIKEKEKTKKVLDKIKTPKKAETIDKLTAEKVVKNKKISFDEKLKYIRVKVFETLKSQLNNVLVIDNRDDFHNYITKAIDNKIIAIDTETNNSLDPITCRIMGLCLYTTNEKQVYIPINHIDRDTGEKLDNQCTELDIKEELTRLVEANTFTVTHNGKFDYQVIKCTCDGMLINIDWDTMIGAKLLDENESSAGLKWQYIHKIDPDQEKYDIEELFEGVEYAQLPPELFALYAATDSMMTLKLYEWQMKQFENPDLSGVLNLAKTIEMPLVKVIAEMELKGMEVDLEYADLLSKKFHKRLDDVDIRINAELLELKPKIDAWRLTDNANFKPILGRSKRVNGISYKYMSASSTSNNKSYWYEADSKRELSNEEASKLGLNATEQKSKSEQLTDPINLASPTQLAILFYDILKAPVVDKKQPRATGEDALKAIADKLHLKICDLILDRRELVKLLTTYIDPIPQLAQEWPDKRIRSHFQQYGADTGRLSSGGKIVFGPEKEYGGLNYQNIPSHEKTIRMLFKAYDNIQDNEIINNKIIVKKFDKVNTPDGWVYIDKIHKDDIIIIDDNENSISENIRVVSNIFDGNNYIITI